jgi:predicted O-linked N-acetylglucosamine transferase (SPINDLY family)
VAASLLTRAGLPQFIAQSLAEYEQKALDFAQNPSLLKMQAKKSALFDATQFARDIEKQYLNTYIKC